MLDVRLSASQAYKCAFALVFSGVQTVRLAAWNVCMCATGALAASSQPGIRFVSEARTHHML